MPKASDTTIGKLGEMAQIDHHLRTGRTSAHMIYSPKNGGTEFARARRGPAAVKRFDRDFFRITGENADLPSQSQQIPDHGLVCQNQHPVATEQ